MSFYGVGILSTMKKQQDAFLKSHRRQIVRDKATQKEALKENLVNTKIENLEIVTGLSDKLETHLQPKFQAEELPTITIGNDKNYWIKKNWWKLLAVIVPLSVLLILMFSKKSKTKNLA